MGSEKEEDGPGGKARDTEAAEANMRLQKPFPSFFNLLIASVNLIIVFCREAILDSW